MSSINLDYKDVADRIDVFITTGLLFTLFDFKDIQQILKQAKLTPELMLQLATKLPNYLEPEQIIQFWKNVNIQDWTDMPNLHDHMQAILHSISIPVLESSFARLHSNKLQISTTHELEIITK